MTLTNEEWNEMNAIRMAMNDNPASVHPDKMERFTELFVRSLPKDDFELSVKEKHLP